MVVNPAAANGSEGAAQRKRGGRPSAEQAGEVDRRILDAATSLFLRSGFDATSCDQVLALAGAGKATLYARYANKDALFSAVVRRMVEQTVLAPADLRPHMPVRERLRVAGGGLLQRFLAEDWVALMRVCVASAPRLPDLARLVEGATRDGGLRCIVRALTGEQASAEKAELAGSTAGRLFDMVLVPLQMRALFGEERAWLDGAAPAMLDEAIDILARAGLLTAFET